MRLLVPAACLAVTTLTVAAAPTAPPPAAAPRTSDATSRVRFEDVASSAALPFTHAYSPTPEKHIIESVPGGVATFDADGDGRTDIFFTNGATSPGLTKSSSTYWNRLFRDAGNGRFEDITEKAGVQGRGYAMGAAAADFDNDGDVDLFVAGVRENQLLRNAGQGRFEDVTEKSGIASGDWAVAAGWFDFDLDSHLDLFVVNYVSWTPAFDRYCGDDARKIRVYCHPRYFEGRPNRLYRNKGDGTFEDVTERSGIGSHVGKGMSLAFLDFDGNGHLDVFVTNDGVPNFLFRNTGKGTFEEMALIAGVAVPSHGRAVSSMGTDAQDYDNDGSLDISVTALTGETYALFRGDGRGTFLEATHASGMAAASARRSGWCTVLLDVDNDGAKDLFTTGSHVNDRIDAFESTTWKQPNTLFHNLGGGRFALAERTGLDARSAAHRGCATLDVEGDGRVDLVVSALGSPAELWRNVSAGAGHWLVVRLVGTKSNRDGIGALVQVGQQVRLMTTAAGYASSSYSGMHFGVGTATEIPRVEVRWPSGTTQVLQNVKVDRTITIQEP